MVETQKIFAILISLICQHYITHSFKYCDAKFAHRVYKQAYEYRSPSVVALNANCNRKTARQEASEKKALLEYGISLIKAVRAVLYAETTFNSNSLRRRTRQSCQTSSSLLNLAFSSNYIKSDKLKIHFPNSPHTGHV